MDSLKKMLFCVFKIALLFFYLSGGGATFAESQIIYRTPTMSDIDFAALKIARPEMITLDEYQLKNIVSDEMKENLKTTFLKAHAAHLKNQSTENIDLWQDVISYAFKADWPKNNREMIQIAYLRLAELSATVKISKSLVTQCFEYDPQFEPDRKLITPTVIAQYQDVQTKSPLKNFDLNKLQGFSKVLINGTVFDVSAQKSISVTSGLKRITLLSSTYKPVTRVIDAEYLNQLKPEKENAIPENRNLLDNRYIAKSSGEPSIEKKNDEKSAPQFYKKPWFWVGTVGVVGALVIYQNSKQNNSSREPTYREGL